MRISIKLLHGQEFSLAVSASSEVREVKELIHTLMSIPTEEQKLLYRGKVLLDNKFLKDYNVQDESELTLMVKKSAKRSRSPPSPTASDDSVVPTPMPLPPVWEKLHTFLKRHFLEKDVELVLMEFRKKFDEGLAQLSLDDIERLATTKLRQMQQ